ncbi:hypothetical protein BJV82DRAFT_623325 [Fennellomyces sp. T-0311]|nr:hypothetical protein BJV82DRAFT_623325 [Fennellomyces sp. T-0311]
MTVSAEREYDPTAEKVEENQDHWPPPPFRVATREQVIKETLQESYEARQDPYVFDKHIRRVAVIGAGPAGLPTAKALKEHGFQVRCFERLEDVGGVWVYSEQPPVKPSIPCNSYPTKAKPIQEEDRIVQVTPTERINKLRHAPPSACYPDLYNNASAPHMMDYEDFPWPKETEWYLPHNELQKYYKDYAEHYGLFDLIEFSTNVEFVERTSDGWVLTLRKAEYINNKTMIHYKTWTETFDAVTVASGVYTDPFLPDFQHLQEYDAQWPERIIHSKQYRHWQDYNGKNVLLIGSHVSAVDIAQRLDGSAKNVYMAVRGQWHSVSKILNLVRSVMPESTIRKPNIRSFSDPDGNIDGSITFEDGTVVRDIDRVIFCTGFITDYGFLGPLRGYKGVESDQDPLVIVDGRRPLNTYRDIFLVRDPTLAFTGVPSHLNNTGFFYYQGQAVARVWAGLAMLPSQEKMQRFIETSVQPYPPFDMSLLSVLLNSQRLVTWLNAHAEKPGLYVYKGTDPDILPLWEKMESGWRMRTEDILRRIKS